MTDNRVSRGRKTEQLVADWFIGAGVFPKAERRPASLPGSDIINTPGYYIEVKARRSFKPLEWIRQAQDGVASLEGEAYRIPVCIMRPDGIGDKNVGNFLAFTTLNEFTWMVNRIQVLEAMLMDGISNFEQDD